MTEIRIRHEDEGRAALLGDVPFDQIDNVIPALHTWGFSDDQKTEELVGQFVYDPKANKAYFEVVIVEDED